MTLSVSTLKKMSSANLLNTAIKLGIKADSSTDRNELIAMIERKQNGEPEAEPEQIVKLRDQIKRAAIKHVEVHMPVAAIMSEKLTSGKHSVMIEFANGIRASVNRIGLQYMAYRFRATGAGVTDFLTGKINGSELMAQFNDAWTASDPKKRGKLIAAVYQGELVGLMRNYTPVSHEELVNELVSNNIGDQIQWSSVDPFKMHMIVSTSVAGKFVAGLRITNGHSGHVSFTYASTFQLGDFEFDIPLSDRVRHLKSVTQSVSNLKLLIEAASELRIDEMLRQTSIHEVQSIVRTMFLTPSKRQTAILENAEIGKDCSNALEYVVALGDRMNNRGYKKAVTSIMSKLIDEIVRRYTGKPA